MKKVLSFVLVLSMILGSFGMAFAAAPADVVGKDYEDAVNVLTELGVVAGYKDGTYRPENVVTRAEMATFLIKAMGLADYAVGKSEFSDMAGHWADPFVAYAVSLGFVKGNTDGTFAPDATVSYDQAITMVVQALGYKGEYLVGGYPGAFVNQAKALGLLDGLKVGAAGANRGDIATLLFNALDEAFVRYSTDGVLQAAGGSMMTRLGAAEYATGAAFVVKGTEPSVIGLKDYQGAYATAYANKDGKIIAMEEVKSVFIKGDFDATAKTFTLADDTEYKTDRVMNDAVSEFVNGEYTTEGAFNTSATGITIAVELSGKYIDAVYSVASWTGATTVMWDEDLAEDLAENDKLDGKAFAMTDNDEIDADSYVIVGVASLEDIEEDDIVTYYTASGEVVRVEVAREVVEGKITKVNAAGDEVTINGKKYDVVNLLSGSDAVVLTAEGTFYLNSDGDIVYADTTVEADDYAIVTVANNYDSAAFGETSVMKIKMITVDGKEAVYAFDKDYTVTVGAFSTNAVVIYSLDKDGEIDSMATVQTTTGSELSAKGYLDGKPMASNVVVFEKDGTDYTVVTKADIPVNEDLLTTKYAEKNGEVVVVVLDAAATETADSVYGVVLSAGKVKDADDTTVWEVEMLVDGAAKTYLTKAEGTVVPTDAALYELQFEGSAVATFGAVTAESITAGATVAAIKDGNIQLSGNTTYEEVAADAVVYLINKDGDLEVSKIGAISKGDVIVYLYELDGAADDKDGIDVVIYDAK